MKLIKLITLTVLLSHATLSSAQYCNPNIIATAPDSRYILNTNGTVLDKRTGLMWMRCPLGQTWTTNNTCTGTRLQLDWDTALERAEYTGFAGFGDWRLPNLKELQSLVESRCYEPAVNINAFPTMPSSGYVWSSTPTLVESDTAWGVGFNSGVEINITKSHNNYIFVLLVRGGK